MTVLINAASADTESSTISATGPVIVSVVGTFKSGMFRVTADLGSGEATAFTCSPNSPVKIARLEFASGIDFKVYLEGVSSDSEVTVEYIDA